MTTTLTRSQRLAIWLMMGLYLIGIAASIYLTVVHFDVASGGGKQSCDISGTINCSRVAASPYSEFLGVPISILGLLTYGFTLLLAASRLTSWRKKFPYADVWLEWIGLGSSAYTLFLLWICMVEIGALCLGCTVLYAVNFLTCFLALVTSEVGFLQYPAKFVESIKFCFSGLGRTILSLLVLVAAIVMFTFGLAHKAEVERIRLESVAKVESKFKKIKTSVELKGAFMGQEAGPIVFVVYTDYFCPFCHEMEADLLKAVQEHPNVKLIRKNFPLDMTCNRLMKRVMHPGACDAARYASCADRQGKFAEFNANLLRRPFKEISGPTFEEAARQVGINMEELNACLLDPTVDSLIKGEIEEALTLGIVGTPLLLLKGPSGMEELTDAISYEEIDKLIQIRSEARP